MRIANLVPSGYTERYEPSPGLVPPNVSVEYVEMDLPALRECHEAQLREYQLTEQCASMRFVTTDEEMLTIAEPDSFYVRMRSRKADMIERIGAQARAGVEEDGAHVIVLGRTCMVPVAPDLAALVDVPVVKPLDAVFLQAQMLVQLGLSHSVRAHQPSPVPRGATFSALTKQAKELIGPPTVGQDCEPCAVVRTAR